MQQNIKCEKSALQSFAVVECQRRGWQAANAKSTIVDSLAWAGTEEPLSSEVKLIWSVQEWFCLYV